MWNSSLRLGCAFLGYTNTDRKRKVHSRESHTHM